MGDDYMQNEIEELRAQVAELTAERTAREKEEAQAGNSQPPTGESAAQVSGSTESTEAVAGSVQPEDADLTSQLQELIETIDEELKATSPMTVLVVFALGVVVGRLLPR